PPAAHHIIAPGHTRGSAGRPLIPHGGTRPARPPRRSPSLGGHTLDDGPQHEGGSPHRPTSPRPASARRQYRSHGRIHRSPPPVPPPLTEFPAAKPLRRGRRSPNNSVCSRLSVICASHNIANSRSYDPSTRSRSPQSSSCHCPVPSRARKDLTSSRCCWTS